MILIFFFIISCHACSVELEITSLKYKNKKYFITASIQDFLPLSITGTAKYNNKKKQFLVSWKKILPKNIIFKKNSDHIIKKNELTTETIIQLNLLNQEYKKLYLLAHPQKKNIKEPNYEKQKKNDLTPPLQQPNTENFINKTKNTDFSSLQIITKTNNCHPIIDLKQKLFHLQQQTLLIHDGKVISATSCHKTTTHKLYPQYISHKINSTNVTIIFNFYYLDKNGTKIEIEKSEQSITHKLLKKKCPVIFDWEILKAFPQEGFYLESILKNIDIPCQKIIDHPGYHIDFRIIGFSHDNDLFVSYPKLEYFYEHETQTIPILIKIDTENPFYHLWKDISPIYLEDTQEFIHRIQRSIITPQGEILIGEPIPVSHSGLATTDKTCEVIFEHNWDRGFSTQTLRYFYENDSGITFVTPCIPIGETIKHTYKIEEYQHNDREKISIPLVSIWIEKIKIKSKELLCSHPPIPYEWIESKWEPSDINEIREGFLWILYHKTELFQRANDSVFTYKTEESKWVKNKFQGKKIIERRVKERYIETKYGLMPCGTYLAPLPKEYFHDELIIIKYPAYVDGPITWTMYGQFYEQTREKIEFPDGTTEYTPWEWSDIPVSSKRKIYSKQG